MECVCVFIWKSSNFEQADLKVKVEMGEISLILEGFVLKIWNNSLKSLKKREKLKAVQKSHWN